MRYPLKYTVLAICLCAVLSGCATMRYPHTYKVEGKEFAEFKDLDDEKALKVVAMIYNVKNECRDDKTARSIALEEYLNLLSKRKSQYIKNSGIFNAQYEKVQLSTYGDEELLAFYQCLEPKAMEYSGRSDLTEVQNAERIVYLTAINAVVKEMKKRDITQKAIVIAGQVLSAALTVALAMI
jgi:hypothetical protein